ncbi:MAG TPA: hypothetical protein P5181_01760 [Dermatophilaceae bacterium]|nr:hypothetical protein [Dermatophilaceae bacterium]
MSGLGRRAFAPMIAAGLMMSAGACTDNAAGPAPTTAVPAVGTSSAPTTTTPSPSPTPTTQSDTDLAMAAAQRFVVALNDAVRTQDSAEFRKTYVPGCIVCGKDADRIDSYRASGRTVQGGSSQFTGVQVETVQADSIILKGTMSVEPVQIRDSTGKIVESYPAFTNGRRVMMLRVNGTWLVEGVFA